MTELPYWYLYLYAPRTAGHGIVGHDVVLAIEDVLQRGAQRQPLTATTDADRSPKRGIYHHETIHLRAWGMLAGGPSAGLSAGRQRKVCPRIEPAERGTTGMPRRIGQLPAAIRRAFGSSVHSSLPTVIGVQRQRVAATDSAGARCRDVGTHDCRLAKIADAPYKHVEWNGQNLVRHLIYIYIAR